MWSVGQALHYQRTVRVGLLVLERSSEELEMLAMEALEKTQKGGLRLAAKDQRFRKVKVRDQHAKES